MHGDSEAFGAIRAVPGVSNAIQIASLLAKKQTSDLSLLGIVLPTITEAEEWLITKRANLQWEEFRRRLDKASAVDDHWQVDAVCASVFSQLLGDDVMDTIGVIYVDSGGYIASGSS
ncbi:unnamed protein product [Coffea canephora]|uniref:Uncharacterized protein n=1 Tax=Coffea canephora TaxID=49390 RepID=A0A068VAS7_COFCA|nr:unnamed protein product [Coffea canephora]